MKLLLMTILSVLSFSNFASAGSLLDIDQAKETVRINSVKKSTNINNLAIASRDSALSLPVEQLNRDFKSLLKQNGKSDRESVRFDEADFDLKADLGKAEGSPLESENNSKL